MKENDISIAPLYKDQFELYQSYLNDEGRHIHFRDNVLVYGAFADEEETLAGVLMLEVSTGSGSVRVVSVSVTPSMQHKGVGSMMTDYALGDCMAQGHQELRVLLDADADGTSGYDSFFWRCGFSPRRVYPAVTASLEAIRKSTVFQRIERVGHNPSNVIPLSRADDYTRRKLEQSMFTEQGYAGVLSEPYAEDVSMVFVEKDFPVGCLLAAEESGVLTVQNLFVSKTCTDKRAVYKMFIAAADAAENAFGSETIVSLSGALKETQLFIESFDNEKDFTQETVTEWALPFSGEPAAAEESPTEPAEAGMTGANRFTDNGFSPVSNSQLTCADCIYCTEGAGDCHKYSMKPSGVLYGGTCKYYRKREVNA